MRLALNESHLNTTGTLGKKKTLKAANMAWCIRLYAHKHCVNIRYGLTMTGKRNLYIAHLQLYDVRTYT